MPLSPPARVPVPPYYNFNYLLSEDSFRRFSVEAFGFLKMNQLYHQKNAFGAREEARGFEFSDQRESVVCPKPRRVGILANNSSRPLRWQLNHLVEVSDSNAGAELLDIILTKEGYGSEQTAYQVASSPPYFCGSPPSRAANPLIQDARFGDEKLTPLQVPVVSSPSGLLSPSSSARKAGCTRMKFGLKPATVRVEGFDCLNRDRQNSSIAAMA